MMFSCGTTKVVKTSETLKTSNKLITEYGKIKFFGGTGSSKADAIIIKGASGEMDGIQAEYYYIGYKYGARGTNWQSGGQALYSENGKFYDSITFTTLKDGIAHKIYFDITDFYGKF